MTDICTGYEDILEYVHRKGVYKGDRTGTGTYSLFGLQARFDLRTGFPLVTTKKVAIAAMTNELIWFLRGDTNVKWLQEHKCKIWDEWADANGDLGPIYGKQWRSWEGASGRTHDQIATVIHDIKTNPNSRRLLVSAWNVDDLDKMALHPCHALFQFYVSNGELSCQLYQRSADMFLGVPFNIASYALLTHMVAQQCGLEVGDFIWTGGDCHIYSNHLPQVELQLSRPPYPKPTLVLNKRDSIEDYTFEDVLFKDYLHHPAIPAPVAV